MKCKPVIDRKAIQEDHTEDLAKLDHMADLIKNDPLVRLHMGIPIDSKSNVKFEFDAWAKTKFGVDPSTPGSMDKGIINHLYAEILRGRSVIDRSLKFKDKSAFMGWLHKMIYLPQTVFSREIIRGEDIWVSTQMLKHRADHKRISVTSYLEGLAKGFEKLTNVTAKEVEREIYRVESNLARALDMQKVVSTHPTSTNSEKHNARNAVDSARQELAAVYRGDIENKTLGTAIRLQRSLTLALNGKFLTHDASGNEIIRPLKIREVETNVPSGKDMAEGEVTQTKKVLDRKGLDMALQKANPGIDWKASKEAGGLLKSVGEFLSEFGDVAKQGFKAERNNLFYELTRGEAMMTPEEANQAIDRMISFEKLDLYFPQKSLSHLARVQGIMNGMRGAADQKGFIRDVIQHGDEVIFRRAETGHTKPRTVDYQRRDVSQNMFRVLSEYSNEVVTYWHDNRVSEILNKYINEMWKARNALPKGVRQDQFEDYMRGVSQYLTQFAEISKNAPTGGKLEEVSKIATAMYAATKMGFWNPSTPLLNVGEGQAVITTRAGWDYLHMTGSRRQKWNDEVWPLIKKEYVDISPGEEMMQYGEGIHSKLLDSMSTNDAARYLEVVKDTNLLWLQKVRKWISEKAGDAIILQTKAENLNRNRAFRIGAMMEYEFVEGQFKAKFDSSSASKLFTDADLRMMFGEQGVAEARRMLSGSKAMRKQAWDKFTKRRVTKAGYEFMYQTQWNYNQAARHYLEHAGPLPKMAMMFQHYPLSWIAAWQRTHGILKSLHQAGGTKAMFHRDPRSRALYKRPGKIGASLKTMAKNKEFGKMGSLGYWTNNEMMFALSAGAIASMVTGLRYGTGIVLGQFWQHPATEVVQDTIRYVNNGFNGEEEKNKLLFWGRGVANEVTGPFFSDFMDAVSLAATKVGIDDGDMPRWTADILRGTLGFRPNELLLTQYGSRRYNNAFDVMNEAFLFGSMTMAPKAARMATSIPQIGDSIYDAGVGPLYETTTGGKLRRKEDPGLNDLFGAIGRSIGIRDERSMEEFLEARIKREFKQ